MTYVLKAMSDHGLLAINADCSISTVDLFDDHRCVVVDNFLADPLGARAYALKHGNEFALAGGYYPGPELAVPEAMLRAFDSWWKKNLCGPLRILRGGAATQARYSIVTKQPHEVGLKKRFCHQDRLLYAYKSDPVGVAGVLYLFDEPKLGGTSFFRIRDDASFDEIDELSRQRRYVELFAKYPFLLHPPRYMVDSNPLFERMEAIGASFNRAIFYDRSIYHSPDIRAPELLTSDLEVGRLTMNFFIDASRA